MAQSTLTCPVCGQTVHFGETFCGKCGFEIHFLSEPVSPDVSSYEKGRVEKFRSLLSEKTLFESSLSEARSEAESLKEKASSLEEKMFEDKKDRELLEKDLSHEKEESASLKKEVVISIRINFNIMLNIMKNMFYSFLLCEITVSKFAIFMTGSNNDC